MKFTDTDGRTIRWKIAGCWEGDPKRNGKLQGWDVLREEEAKDAKNDGSNNNDNQSRDLDPGMPVIAC